MSVIGLRVGPFEIVENASIPEPGTWCYARRTGQTRRHPNDVLVRLLDPSASTAERADLQRQFDLLRGIEDARIPAAVALYEGMGALAIHAVRGTPLGELVRRRTDDEIQMSPATLLDIALEIAETLQHMHHTGNAHGHLSAENVVLAPDGKVWLFGVGQGSDAEPASGWQAPERARGEAASQATDQWCLAAICGALVTGRIPWQSDDPGAEATRGDIEPIIEPIMSQWPALARLLQRLLDTRPENRHANMHPVRQELLALARKAGGTSQRRELGALLARRRAAEQEAADERDAAAEAAATAPESAPTLEDFVLHPKDEGSEVEQEPSAEESPAGPPSEDEIPIAAVVGDGELPESERKPQEKLPEEEIPVVRPDVKGDVPTAHLGRTNTSEPEDGTIEAESERQPEMTPRDPNPVGSEPDSLKGDDSDTPDSLASANPDRLSPLSASFADDEEDEEDEAATVLYGREAIDKILAAPIAPDRSGPYVLPVEVELTDDDPTPPSEGPPAEGPTAVPTTDSRDPSEEIPRPGSLPGGEAQSLDEPGLGTGRMPNIGNDMPSGPALGNPEEIAPPADLPERNMTAQRVAMAFVGVMGLAMLLWMLSTLL